MLVHKMAELLAGLRAAMMVANWAGSSVALSVGWWAARTAAKKGLMMVDATVAK